MGVENSGPVGLASLYNSSSCSPEREGTLNWLRLPSLSLPLQRVLAMEWVLQVHADQAREAGRKPARVAACGQLLPLLDDVSHSLGWEPLGYFWKLG